MDALFLIGIQVLVTTGVAIRRTRGRERVLAVWRLLVTSAPSVACATVTIVGVSRGFATGEKTLPLVLTALLGLFGAAVPFPLIGGMLAMLTERPMRWLLGVTSRRRTPNL